MPSGKDLEEAFDRGQAHYLPEMVRISQPNITWLARKAGVTSFASKQLPDRILLSRRDGCWCFELKMCQEKTFAFARLKPHQARHLEEFAEKVGKAYVVISFQGLVRVFAIPIAAYHFLEKSMGTKSLKMVDLLSAMAGPHPDYPKDAPIKDIPVEIPVKHPRLNLGVLVTRDVRDFFKDKNEPK